MALPCYLHFTGAAPLLSISASWSTRHATSALGLGASHCHICTGTGLSRRLVQPGSKINIGVRGPSELRAELEVVRIAGERVQCRYESPARACAHAHAHVQATNAAAWARLRASNTRRRARRAALRRQTGWGFRRPSGSGRCRWQRDRRRRDQEQHGRDPDEHQRQPAAALAA